MSDFKKTDRTTLTRLPKRGSYDQHTIYSILDEALYCTVAFATDNQPWQIPTGFCRIGNQVYIHGSVGAHYMRQLAQGKLQVCVCVTLLDGLVLARSAFHHSVNYRSVIFFSEARQVTDAQELYQALEVFTNKMQPGRWDDVRKPTEGEWKATMVIAFELDEASAKIRTGSPKDDPEDYELNVWAGVVPLVMERKAPLPDPELKRGVALPVYLQQR